MSSSTKTALFLFQDGVHMHISEQWRNHEATMETMIESRPLCRPWRKGLRIKNQGEMVILLRLTLFVAQPWKPWKWHISNLKLLISCSNLLPLLPYFFVYSETLDLATSHVYVVHALLSLLALPL